MSTAPSVGLPLPRRRPACRTGDAPGRRRPCARRPGKAARRLRASARRSRSAIRRSVRAMPAASSSSRRSMQVAVGRRLAHGDQSQVIPHEEVRQRAPDAVAADARPPTRRARRPRSRTGSRMPASRPIDSAGTPMKPKCSSASSAPRSASIVRAPAVVAEPRPEPENASSGLAEHGQMAPVPSSSVSPSDADRRPGRCRGVCVADPPAAGRRTRAPPFGGQVARPPVARAERAHRDLHIGHAGAGRRAAEPRAQRQRHRPRIEAARLDADVADDRVVVRRRRGRVGGRDRADRDWGGRRGGAAPSTAAGELAGGAGDRAGVDDGAAAVGPGRRPRPAARSAAPARTRSIRPLHQPASRSGARTGYVPLPTRQTLGRERASPIRTRSRSWRGCRRRPPATHFS